MISFILIMITSVNLYIVPQGKIAYWSVNSSDRFFADDVQLAAMVFWTFGDEKAA